MQRIKWHRAGRSALLATVGILAFGLMAAFLVHEYIKGRGETMARGREAEAAELMVAPPPIDESQPKTFETATFALG